MTAGDSHRRGAPLREPDTSTYRGRFAARLRELRARKFGTQDEFVEALQAAGLACSRTTVSSWETGHRLPSIELLPDIAGVLATTPRTLLPAE